MAQFPLRYLAWARRYYGQVAFDLATSGLPSLSFDELSARVAGTAPAPNDFGQLGVFQRAVGERYGVAAEGVFPCLGTSAGLWTACALLTNPGDEVLVEQPGYEPLWAVPLGLGRTVRRFDRTAESGFGIVPESLKLSARTRLVILANPHNPTGVFLDDAAIGALADALAKQGAVLLVDEVYREFVAPKTTSFGVRANVRVASSLTKRFGVGWARSGWLLLHPSELDTAWDALAQSVGSPPPWSAGIGAWVLANADRVGEYAIRGLSDQAQLVEAFARRHADRLAFTRPSGRVPFAWFVDRRGDDLLLRIEQGIASQSVLVAPGAFFGTPSGFRLSFTSGRESVVEGLRRLERVLAL